MDLFTKTFLFFSIAFMVIYILGWAVTFVEYCRMAPVQKRYTNIEVSVPEMLGFILSVCYTVAYWMM